MYYVYKIGDDINYTQHPQGLPRNSVVDFTYTEQQAEFMVIQYKERYLEEQNEHISL